MARVIRKQKQKDNHTHLKKLIYIFFNRKWKQQFSFKRSLHKSRWQRGVGVPFLVKSSDRSKVFNPMKRLPSAQFSSLFLQPLFSFIGFALLLKALPLPLATACCCTINNCFTRAVSSWVLCSGHSWMRTYPFPLFRKNYINTPKVSYNHHLDTTELLIKKQ